jgi:hypothetical protein
VLPLMHSVAALSPSVAVRLRFHAVAHCVVGAMASELLQCDDEVRGGGRGGGRDSQRKWRRYYF